MSIPSNLLKTFSHCDSTIVYNSPKQSVEIIETIAERIADLYAAFLTRAYHHNTRAVTRSKALMFYDFPSCFPTEQEVANFTSTLKKTIVEQCNGAPVKRMIAIRNLDNGLPVEVNDIIAEYDQDDTYSDGIHIKLSTDGAPETTLLKILQQSGIDDRYPLYKLFPCKTCTTLWMQPKLKKIKLHISI